VIIKISFAALKETTAKDYAIRFVLGGLVTVATGLIATKFGPAVGGLFLAFPAIFPATATLIASQQKEKKERVAMNGEMRGRLAVAVEAKGTSLGTLGLVAFLLTAYSLLKNHSLVLALSLAIVAWAAVSVLLWFFVKRVLRR
jgi:Ca2+/H+ antiporter